MEYSHTAPASAKDAQRVTLYDADGSRLGETFPRRARQLVKQQRAMWTDDSHTALRFAPDAAEDWETDHDTVSTAPAAPPADASLLELARKRLSTRRLFYLYTVALLPGYVFWVIIADTFFWQVGWRAQHFNRGFFIGAMFMLWTVLYVLTVYRFIKCNRGVYPFPFNLMEKRYERKLALEVEKMKGTH